MNPGYTFAVSPPSLSWLRGIKSCRAERGGRIFIVFLTHFQLTRQQRATSRRELGWSFQEHGRVTIFYYVYFMTKTPIYRCRPAEVLSGAAAVLFQYHPLTRKLRVHPRPPPNTILNACCCISPSFPQKLSAHAPAIRNAGFSSRRLPRYPDRFGSTYFWLTFTASSLSVTTHVPIALTV